MTVFPCAEPEEQSSGLNVEHEMQGDVAERESTQSTSPQNPSQETKVPVFAVSRVADREWLLSTIRACTRNTLYGVAWEIVLRISPALLRRKLPKLSTLFSEECLKSAARRGAMLGSWVAIFRILSRVSQSDLVERRLHNCNHSEARTQAKHQFYRHSYRLAIAAFISGFASVRLFPGISWQMTVYFACRAARAMLDVECKRGSVYLCALARVPTWLWFSITAGSGIGYLGLFKPLFLPRGFMDFLCVMSRQGNQQMNDIFNPPGDELMPCQPAFHTGACRPYVIDGLRYASLKSFRFFFAFYAISRVIIRSPRALLRAPLHSVYRLAERSVRSSIFVVLISWGCSRMPCLLRPFVKKLKPINTVPLVTIACFSQFLESDSRQMEIFIYNASTVITTLLNIRFGINVRAFPRVKTPRTLVTVVAPLLFGLSSAAWVCARQVSADSLKPTEKFLLDNILPLHEKSVQFGEAQPELQKSSSAFQLAIRNLLR
eukprot:780244_1